MRAVVVAFLLFTAAGCVTEQLEPAAVDAPAEVPLPLARLVSVIDPAGGLGEPSLGVAPDGTFYVNGEARQNGVQTGSVYASSDGGATWTLVALPAVTPNLDPDLAVDIDGTVWFSGLWVGCSTVASSRDGGRSWTSSPLACVPVAGDRQYVVPTQGGTAYIYSHQRPMYQQMVAKTTDYGATWIPLGSAEPLLPLHHPFLNEGSGWGGGGFWNAAHDSIFFTYTWWGPNGSISEPPEWRPAFSVSRDGGASWEVGKLPHLGGDPVGLSLVVGAADAAGNVYLAWAASHDGGKDMAIYVATSSDDGRTWSAPKRVDDGTGSKLFPTIAAGAAGKVAIAYYESDESVYPASASEDAAWRVTLSWTNDALADAPTFEHGSFSPSTVRHGAICPDGFACQENREFADYFALEALPDGRVASVWTSTDDVDGKIVNVFGVTDAALLR